MEHLAWYEQYGGQVIRSGYRGRHYATVVEHRNLAPAHESRRYVVRVALNVHGDVQKFGLR